MRTYRGLREGDGLEVTVDGRFLNPCFHIVQHSPTGFECGYMGSGPAQLALAILVDHLQHHEEDLPLARRGAALDDQADARTTARSLHQGFKAGVIAKLPRDRHWTLTSEDVRAALSEMAAFAEGILANHNEALSAFLAKNVPSPEVADRRLVRERLQFLRTTAPGKKS